MSWLRRLLRREEWIFLVGAILLAGGAFAFYTWSRPATLTVAVAPRDSGEARLIEAYAEALVREKKDMRLRLSMFDSVRESAEAMAHGKADLAIVRPDVTLPENGMTIAILRQEAVILLAPEGAKITDIAGLDKKRLGVVARHSADPDAIAKLLGEYDLRAPGVTLVPLQPDEVEAAFLQKRVDALAMVAAPVGAGTERIVRAIERAAGKKVVILAIPEGDALTLRNPSLVSLTIPAGAYGGRPKLPADDVKTVGVSYRLMARSDLDRDRVARVTEYLFEMRSRLAQVTPSAYQLASPPYEDARNATSAILPNHPGAIDYLQREQQTFFMRYGDWIYLLMFSGGGLFSAAAWLMQRFARKRREVVDKVLDRLIDILGEARAATNAADLDNLSLEIDGLVVHAVRYARHHATGTRSMSALILALDSARAAIADCRRSLVGTPVEAPGPSPAGRFARLIDVGSS